jgi:alkanesulfonate monooxygenase SsuD/methylene tetrahydromethanopterin reductase-like flavin-dependent oxidoreductase (luciferase family)
MLGFNCFAAPTDEEAELLATSVQQAVIALRTGTPGQLQPPKSGYAESLPLEGRAMLQNFLTCSAIGSPATVRREVKAFVERTGADELIVTSQIFDPEARLRSYELLMEAMAPAEPQLAR